VRHHGIDELVIGQSRIVEAEVRTCLRRTPQDRTDPRSRPDNPKSITSARLTPSLHAGGTVCGIHGFNGPQKNAIIRSNPGSSGECRTDTIEHLIVPGAHNFENCNLVYVSPKM
jgi:hypothetical protein